MNEGLLVPEACFSAIARSVMISASSCPFLCFRLQSFSAIARSVMISAELLPIVPNQTISFSAIARSVMISAKEASTLTYAQAVSVL